MLWGIEGCLYWTGSIRMLWGIDGCLYWTGSIRMLCIWGIDGWLYYFTILYTVYQYMQPPEQNSHFPNAKLPTF